MKFTLEKRAGKIKKPAWTRLSFRKQGSSKYKNTVVEYKGKKFHSIKEREFYKELENDSRVAEITLQPAFLLQEGFVKRGEEFRAITYKADFLVLQKDGRRRVIDIKGFETPEFKIKRKLFEAKYPDLTLELL